MNVAAKLDEGLIGADFAIEREEYDVAWGGSGHIDVDPCPDSGPVFALLHVYTAQDSFTLAIRPGPDHREGAAGLLALGGATTAACAPWAAGAPWSATFTNAPPSPGWSPNSPSSRSGPYPPGASRF